MSIGSSVNFDSPDPSTEGDFNTKKMLRKFINFFLIFICSFGFAQTNIEWEDTVMVDNNLFFSKAEDSLANNRSNHRINYGSEYGRMLKLDDGTWLAAYTVSRNLGYEEGKDGGFELEIVESHDNGRTWKKNRFDFRKRSRYG